ncbi:xanthine phosphoribosyltransferase [Fructilactobacillus cliffordii]|uniref:xanthine phosphoribosyltransferase n=1 Tax=Fructilactobacillus cliffordii TaxID=2940299 RepID=UPI0020926D37|nr:xanthine phosphoribosyltransferase [Fructilactobacillus cliffordii]USS86255.1 xanthine phosphoribosyltransferase [Fructilactobacillus cliffordii]
MDALKHAIETNGTVLPGNILKVNSFLNHQIDPQLMQQIGQAFADYFQKAGITKILTVEASGIAPAVLTGLAMHLPVVFARKSKSLVVKDDVYSAEVYSYTKNTNNHIYVEKPFLDNTDRVLIIDDFLANGEATKGLIKITEAAGASVGGIGIVIEKTFQPGGTYLRDHGYDVLSLAQIASLDNQQVKFAN